MKRNDLIFVVLVVLILSGCNGGSITGDDQPTQPVTPIPMNVEGTPILPPTVLPPKTGKGVIAGRLVHSVSGIGLPEQLIYLGDYLPLTPGPGEMVAMQVESSVSTITDANGYFAFEDVEPGDYPLIVWTPFNSKVVADDMGEAALNVEVLAGEVTYLGEVGVLWP